MSTRLYIPNAVTAYDTASSVTTPKAVKWEGPGAGAALSVTRADRNGAHSLGVVTFHETGAFAFAGDTSHQAPQVAITMIMRPLAYDVNADGYAEVFAGAPGENLGDDADTRQFHVLPGTASGTTGTSSKAYRQDTTGVPGDNEDGDYFGAAGTSSNFNGDGRDALAVGAIYDYEDLGWSTGSVTVFPRPQ